jgi:hypothetical protein
MFEELAAGMDEKYAEIQEIAEMLFSKTPDWVTFYRELLGRYGLVRHTFRTPESRQKFEQSETYRAIHLMLAKLLAKGSHEVSGNDEPTRILTLRVPKSFHDAIRDEAFSYRTSMNKLCISKLLQFIDSELVPSPKDGERASNSVPKPEE